jgi:hypothetical protein
MKLKDNQQLVGFIGAKSRTFKGEKYYQNTFVVNDEICQCRDSDNLTGKTAVVELVSIGTQLGDFTVEHEFWRLITTITEASLKTAKVSEALLKGWEDL